MTIMTNFTAADMPGAKAAAKPVSKKAVSFKAPVKAAPEPVIEAVEEETE
jgi:hypothetical protein